MATKQTAFQLLQRTYYDSIDRYDIPSAVTALHENVAWSHAQVWKRHDLGMPASETFDGRDEVEAFLSGVTDRLRVAQITHTIREMVFDEATDKGAFLADVSGRVGSPDAGVQAPFLVWFELRDDLVSATRCGRSSTWGALRGLKHCSIGVPQAWSARKDSLITRKVRACGPRSLVDRGIDEPDGERIPLSGVQRIVTLPACRAAARLSRRRARGHGSRKAVERVGRAGDPPAARNASAMRRAPGASVRASSTLARSRCGLSRCAGRRTPARATSTRRATSGWSRPKGTATIGTPWARAFWVMPMPAWQTTHTARSRTGKCGTKRSIRMLSGAEKVSGSGSRRW